MSTTYAFLLYNPNVENKACLMYVFDYNCAPQSIKANADSAKQACVCQEATDGGGGDDTETGERDYVACDVQNTLMPND